MDILLTGATGVIGRRVVPLLTARGHRVTAPARSQEKRDLLAQAGAEPVALDLFNEQAVRKAVGGKAAVINLATHMPKSTAQFFFRWAWRENDRLRKVGSALLSRAATEAGVGRFIQESFAPVYPDRGAEWIDEQVPLEPGSYNRTVLDAERSAGNFGGAGGTAVILRFAAFYGPDARHLVDMIRIVQRGWAALPGNPDGFLSSVSHDDAAQAVVEALELPGGAYNVVDDEPLTRREYFGSLAQALGAPAPKHPPAWITPLMGSIGRLMARSERISNAKLRSFGFRPRYRSAREAWPSIVEALHAPPQG